MKQLLCIVWLIVSSMTAVYSQKNPFPTDSLDRYIQKGMSDWQIPGLAIAIVKDGKIVFMKGYGVTAVGSSKPINEHTIFQIASQSKLFTATDLCLLEEQKKISLTDPVQKYLPSFAMQDEGVSKLVSIHDLLSHRLGFKNYQGDFVFWDTDLSRQEVISSLRKLKAPYVFRQDFGYSNAAYVVASDIIPKVTGMSWERFTEKTLLEPLQLKETHMLSVGMDKLPDVAHPSTTCCSSDGKLVSLPFDNLDNLGPATGMISSCSDMAKWLMFQLDSGRVNGRQVVPYSVIEKTRTASTIASQDRMTAFPLGFQFYCLGMGLIDYAGHSVFAHAGGSNGYRNNVTFVPAKNLGIVILTNQDNQSFHDALRFQLLDAYLGVPYVNRSSYYLERAKKRDAKSQESIQLLAKRVNQKTKNPIPLTAYVGTYRNELYGTLTISAPTPGSGQTGLTVRFEHHKELLGTLDFMDGHEFRLTLSNPRFGIFPVMFSDTNGAVSGLELKDTDFVDHEAYPFKKESVKQKG